MYVSYTPAPQACYTVRLWVKTMTRWLTTVQVAHLKESLGEIQMSPASTDWFQTCLASPDAALLHIPHICHFIYTGILCRWNILHPKRVICVKTEFNVCKIHGPFSCSTKKVLHLTEKIYTGTACGACDKYEVWDLSPCFRSNQPFLEKKWSLLAGEVSVRCGWLRLWLHRLHRFIT